MDGRMLCCWFLVKVLIFAHLLYFAEASCKNTNTCLVTYTAAELKERLSKLTYHVTQERGTEKAFTGQLLYRKKKGNYHCAVCNNPIFSSVKKYNPGTGWPSFYDVLDKKSITTTKDTRYGWVRQEVSCARCGAHLGHVFSDGPRPTGKRYCMNSVALQFQPKACLYC